MAGFSSVFSFLTGAGAAVGGTALENALTISKKSNTLLDESRSAMERLVHETVEGLASYDISFLFTKEVGKGKNDFDKDETYEQYKKDLKTMGISEGDKHEALQYASKINSALIRFNHWEKALDKLVENNPTVFNNRENIVKIKEGEMGFEDLKLDGIPYTAAELSKLRMPNLEAEVIKNYKHNSGNLRMSVAMAGSYQTLGQSNNAVLSSWIDTLGLGPRYNDLARVCDLFEPHSQYTGDQYKALNLSPDSFNNITDYQAAVLTYLVTDANSSVQTSYGLATNALHQGIGSVFMKATELRYAMQREVFEHIGNYVQDNWDNPNAVVPVSKTDHDNRTSVKMTIPEYFETKGIYSKEDITKESVVDLMLSAAKETRHQSGDGREFSRIINNNKTNFEYLLVTRMDLDPKVAQLPDGKGIEDRYKYKADGKPAKPFQFDGDHFAAGMEQLAASMIEGATPKAISETFGSITKVNLSPEYRMIQEFDVLPRVPEKWTKPDSHAPNKFHNLLGGDDVHMKLGQIGKEIKLQAERQKSQVIETGYQSTDKGLEQITASDAPGVMANQANAMVRAGTRLLTALGMPGGKIITKIMGNNDPKTEYKLNVQDTGKRGFNAGKLIKNVVGTAIETAASPFVGAYNGVARVVNFSAGKEKLPTKALNLAKPSRVILYLVTGVSTWMGIDKSKEYDKIGDANKIYNNESKALFLQGYSDNNNEITGSKATASYIREVKAGDSVIVNDKLVVPNVNSTFELPANSVELTDKSGKFKGAVQPEANPGTAIYETSKKQMKFLDAVDLPDKINRIKFSKENGETFVDRVSFDQFPADLENSRKH